MVDNKYRGIESTLIDKINELEKRIAKLERNPRIGNTSIDKGNLSVKKGNNVFVQDDGGLFIQAANGNQVAFIGRLRGTFTGDDAAHYIQFNRADGSPIIDIFSDDQVPGGTSIIIKDKGSQSIFSDNSFFGGLRDPRLSISWMNDNQASATSASSTLVPLGRAAFTAYHYVSSCEVEVSVPGGSAGELVMAMDFPGNDTSILSVVPIDSGTFSPISVPAYSPEAIQSGATIGITGVTVFIGFNQGLFDLIGTTVGTWVRLVVSLRRTSGAGTLSARVRSWENGGS